MADDDTRSAHPAGASFPRERIAAFHGSESLEPKASHHDAAPFAAIRQIEFAERIRVLGMILDAVQSTLDRMGVTYALIGGMALAARGYPRFTLDLDFLTTDRRVLQADIWRDLSPQARLDIRKGDFDDPLTGVVNISSEDEDIDIVVGKWKWQQAIIERSEPITAAGMTVRVPRTSDLILLKLAAGEPLDLRDVLELLRVEPREKLIAEVNETIGELGAEARRSWEDLLAEER